MTVQIDILMPKNCCECNLTYPSDFGDLYCIFDASIELCLSDDDLRPKNCPLKEVKEHNREGCAYSIEKVPRHTQTLAKPTENRADYLNHIRDITNRSSRW